MDLLASGLETARISSYDYDNEDVIQAIASSDSTALRQHGMRHLKDLHYTRAKTLQASNGLFLLSTTIKTFRMHVVWALLYL